MLNKLYEGNEMSKAKKQKLKMQRNVVRTSTRKKKQNCYENVKVGKEWYLRKPKHLFWHKLASSCFLTFRVQRKHNDF